MMQLQRQFQQNFQLGNRIQVISRRVLSTVESSTTPTSENSVGAADASHAPTVLSGDLAAQVKAADNEKLRGKFVKVGPLLEALEVPRRFEKTEWSTKMYKKGETLSTDEHKKTRDSVPARGGRWDQPSLIDEQERHILLRDQALNLCREMEKAGAENAKPVAKLLVGKRGCGKSATLLTALAYARTNGWLTMYLPRPADLVTEIGAYFSGTAGPVAILPESTIGQGLFQQPNAAKEILEMTDNIHGDVLPLLPQRRKYKHDLYKPKQGQQATLAHILMRGLAQPHRAADALYDLRMEFNLVTEVPVLIAADEFNALYWPTALAFQSRSVKAHQLVVAKAFRFISHVPGDIEDDDNPKAVRRAKLNEEHLPVRGVLIGAVTNSIDPPPHKEQLMPARFEQVDIDNVGKIDVTRYSGEEVQTMLNWYQMKGACRPQSQTDVSLCKIFTGGVGEKVAQYALGMTLGL